MVALHLQEIEADRAGFRALGPDAVPERLLGVLRHQALEFDLGLLVLEEGRPGRAEHAGEFRPGIGGAHVDDPDRLDPRPRRLDAEQPRRLAALDAAPEFLLGGEQEVLVERIGRNGDLDPFAAAGDDRQHRRPGIGDPHVVLELRHMLFGRRLFGERPRQHELGLEHRPGVLDHPVEGCAHPADHRVADPPLHVLERPGGCSARTSAG